MRVRKRNGSISAHAVAGTNVVLFGLDLDEAASKDCLGFGIERVDHTEGESYALDNFLTFRRNDRGDKTDHSSLRNPFQEFLWGDYTAKPAHAYTFAITSMHGTPDQLTKGDRVEVTVTTESETAGTHAIFFNRGVAASQAYVKRYGNKKPGQVPHDDAYKWLSRGLEEALLAFIGRAQGKGWGLRAAFYEFDYLPVHEALRLSAASGADVQIVYDAIANAKNDPRKRNQAAIKKAKITDLVTPRTNSSYIAHNKFIVLLRNDQPIEVWTGSTNITEGGIFGHSNVGHQVRDKDIAATYLKYWELLAQDPPPAELKTFDERVTPHKAQPPRDATIEIFSPRTKLEALEWYASLMDSATQSVFLTGAFGVSKQLTAIFEKQKPYLRYLMLDKDNGTVKTINRDPNNAVTAGGYIGTGGFHQWMREHLTGFNKRVQYLHTKYMLIDPLTDDPIVITGSANFSAPSTNRNDKNMLVIRGDTRVADIYVGEFMRLFVHFRFRARAKLPQNETRQSGGAQEHRVYLRETARWAQRFYVRDSPYEKERVFFR